MHTLSPTKLATYHACPKAYEFRYLRKLPSRSGGSPQLGRTLHQALYHLHNRQSWQGIPSVQDLHQIWQNCVTEVALDPKQTAEGKALLMQYHRQFIRPLTRWQEPIGLEGRVEGWIVAAGVEFRLAGQYDRLELLDPQSSDLDAVIHLIDYKSSRTAQDADALAMDLQMGLYSIAIQQTYQRALGRISHIYLRTGETLSFDITPDHEAKVRQQITEIGQKLLEDQVFPTQPGKHCSNCPAKSHCPEFYNQAIPLPKREISLQLSLLG